MIIFRNANYDNFLSEIGDKRVICYGAGGTLRDFINGHGDYFNVFKKIDAVLDSNADLRGGTVSIKKRSVKITTPADFISKNPDKKDFVILLLVVNKYLTEVIKQLDAIPEFDEIVCYHGLTSLDWSREIYPPLSQSEFLPAPKKDFKIPKIIHYCWFGEAEIPQLQKECIKSWSEYCPEYELKFWNEENYDLRAAPLYVTEAYKAKKYAFVSDYVRLDVVHKFGGFYFDTDVELLKNIDAFTKYKAVFAFETYNLINTGLIFGAIPGNSDVKDLLDIYDDLTFINEDGSYNMIACPYFHTDYFRGNGIHINNTLQLVSDTLFLPSDFFSPLCEAYLDGGSKELTLYALTDNTHGIHKFACSWFDKEQYDEYSSAKELFKEINERLLNDWRKHLK
jgi:hypothetical protein